MSCQDGSNEINMFGLPEDEQYVDEKDTGDEPFRDSQPTQISRDPHLTCMKLLTRKQKTSPTASASAETIRLPSVGQQMQKTSPTAGASVNRIRLPGARLQ
jgi:hypothetical protein